MSSYSWVVIEDGPLLPEQNMDSDYRKLLSIPKESSPTLRFYQWQKKSVTYGYFIDPTKLLNTNGFLLARRPTGGGIIFHDYDLAFSVLIPSDHPHYSLNTLENYSFVNHCLFESIKRFHPLLPVQMHSCTGETRPSFCMARSTIYDLTVHGKKLAGGAIRKTSKGFLHQGSICLQVPDKEFLYTTLKSTSQIKEILKHSFPLMEHCEEKKLEEQKGLLKQCMISSFTSVAPLFYSDALNEGKICQQILD